MKLFGTWTIERQLRWPWWCTPLIPALRRQRQVDLCEFEASLVYRARSRAVTQRNPVSKKKKNRFLGVMAQSCNPNYFRN